MKYNMITIIGIVVWYENKEELILYRMPEKEAIFLAPLVKNFNLELEPKEIFSQEYVEGDRYRHFKGGTIQIIGVALKDNIPSVVYRGEQDQKMYARAISSFEMEAQPGQKRFEKIG